jgi:preprotein translocase subunit SecG
MRTSILLSACLIAKAINSDALKVSTVIMIAIFIWLFIMMDYSEWKKNKENP